MRINKGGCGKFAYFLYKLLSKHGKVKIMAYYDAFSLSHIMVEFNGKFIDSNGVYDKIPGYNEISMKKFRAGTLQPKAL